MKKLKWKPIIKLNIGLKKTFLWYSNNSNYYSTLKRKDIVQRLGIKK
jgi:dTDP-D-glucose 4,6-dehydratase